MVKALQLNMVGSGIFIRGVIVSKISHLVFDVLNLLFSIYSFTFIPSLP